MQNENDLYQPDLPDRDRGAPSDNKKDPKNAQRTALDKVYNRFLNSKLSKAEEGKTYQGQILEETEKTVIQQTDKGLVSHNKKNLSGLNKVNKNIPIEISYPHGKAGIVKDIKPMEHANQGIQKQFTAGDLEK